VTGSGLLILAPLGIEARALGRGAPEARVVRTGMGPARSRAALDLARAAADGACAVAVGGFAGALRGDLRPGEVVVASEVRAPDGTGTRSPAAPLVAAVLRRRGLRVHVGPVESAERIVRGARRAALAPGGGLAVDMESAWLAAAAGERPLAVVRAIVDTPSRDLRRPLATAAGARRARRALTVAARGLAEWAAAVAPREVLLAAPRASCAGVERAIAIVEEALERHGPPVYVRRQIVHNAHVVADLERRGAVFVHEVDEAPEGAVLVLSAHGVPPAARQAAAARRQRVVDATCPLVAKVHAEARRFAAGGYTIVLIGHEGHDEVEGTTGEAPDRIRVVADAGEAAAVEVDDPGRVAYLTQTTLAVDETREVVDALRERFPGIVGPRTDDICYATQNRQEAVRALAGEVDVVLVVGSPNSSNAHRLVEVAERHGVRARLVEDEGALDCAWLGDARAIGVTAAASTPEALVQRVLAALGGLGPVRVRERAVARETRSFRLPPTLDEIEESPWPSR
jgi:4-hydroxy-3-methylbut-2-en-1-yl diphosphate reductase